MPDVFHAHDRSVRAGLQNDVVEFRRVGQPSDRAHAHLICLPRRKWRHSHLAGGNLNVLLLQRAQNVAGSQSPLRHLGRIEPQPHRILPFAENNYVTDALDALHRVLNVHIEVVAQKQAVVLSLGVRARSQNESTGLLCDDDAGILHFIRQTSERLVDPVLHVYGRQVHVARHVECHRHLAGSIVAARGSDVLHSGHAVDGLFHRRRHGRLHRLCVRADINAGHDHLWRRQFRELRNRQSGNCDRAAQHNQQRANRREHRPLDEKVNKHA